MVIKRYILLQKMHLTLLPTQAFRRGLCTETTLLTTCGGPKHTSSNLIPMRQMRLSYQIGRNQNITTLKLPEFQQISFGRPFRISDQKESSKWNMRFLFLIIKFDQTIILYIYLNSQSVAKKISLIQRCFKCSYIPLLQSIPNGLLEPCKEAIKKQNRSRNRYKKMYPCKLQFVFRISLVIREWAHMTCTKVHLVQLKYTCTYIRFKGVILY